MGYRHGITKSQDMTEHTGKAYVVLVLKQCSSLLQMIIEDLQLCFLKKNFIAIWLIYSVMLVSDV